MQSAITKRLVLIPVVLLLLAGLTMGGCAKPAPAKPIELVFSSYNAEKADPSVAGKFFMERVTEKTKGRVTFKSYYGGSLGKAKEVAYLCQDGTVDIAAFSSGYYPAEFGLNWVVRTPYIATNMEALQKSSAQMIKEIPEVTAEFTKMNMRHLAPMASPNAAFVAKKRIETVEDIKGLKSRTVGVTAKIYNRWGGTAVAMPIGQVYESLQKGVVDAAFGTPLSVFVTNSLHEIAKYFIWTGAGITSVLSLGMNLDSYNKLPPDVQKAIDEAADEMSAEFINIRMAGMRKGLKKAVDAGCEIYSLSDDVMAELRDKAAQPAVDDWIKTAAKAGIPKEVAQKVVKRHKELYKQYVPESPKFKNFIEIYKAEFK